VSVVEKQPFLVAYDYGMGGLWGLMHARSEDEIREKYPELVVVTERPGWMTDLDYARMQQSERLDIDEAPKGMLKAVVTDRSRSSGGTG
jgi:hypothetical protein